MKRRASCLGEKTLLGDDFGNYFNFIRATTNLQFWSREFTYDECLCLFGIARSATLFFLPMILAKITVR